MLDEWGQKVDPDMRRVMQAEPFDLYKTTSQANAENMLVRQFNFPHYYHKDDEFNDGWDDRIMSWYGYEHTRQVAKEYGNRSKLNWYGWLQSADPEEIMLYIQKLLKAEGEWTGFRIIISTNRATGYDHTHYCLYRKVNGGDYRLYSDDHAPNVKRTPIPGCYPHRRNNYEGFYNGF